MLVTAFKIQVRRPLHVGVPFQNRRMADPGVKPDIQNIHFLYELQCFRRSIGNRLRQQFSGLLFKPEIRAMLLDQFSQYST